MPLCRRPQRRARTPRNLLLSHPWRLQGMVHTQEIGLQTTLSWRTSKRKGSALFPAADPRVVFSSEILCTTVSNPSSNASSLDSSLRNEAKKKNASSPEGTKTRFQRHSSNTRQLEAVITVEPAQLHDPCVQLVCK
jgi:hypothetical protein